MLFFKKNSTEKKLINLGYDWIVKSYRKQLKNKQLSKDEWQIALEKFYASVAHKQTHQNNVNVATRQSFDDNEVLPALNVSQITLPEYDIEFIKNKIYNDYKTTGKYNRSEIDFLYQLFIKQFAEVEPNDVVASEAAAIDVVTDEYITEKATQISAAFKFLLF